MATRSRNRAFLSFTRDTKSTMKIREVIRMLRDDGWEQVVRKGSHRQFKHPIKKCRVTAAGRLGDELPRGLASILRQAQLKEKP